MRTFSIACRNLGVPSSAPAGEPYSSQEWDSASRAAQWVARTFLGRGLSRRGKRRGAAVVHYAVGGLAGASYAVAGAGFPQLRAGSGAAFGAGMWLLGDEAVMPWAGLTASPAEYSLPMHLHSLGEHVIFGTTTELVCRAVGRVL